jgi:hypothetical protein
VASGCWPPAPSRQPQSAAAPSCPEPSSCLRCVLKRSPGPGKAGSA